MQTQNQVSSWRHFLCPVSPILYLLSMSSIRLLPAKEMEIRDDVLLTLLDNGFTDNYMECMVPTAGVYPIATANDRSLISAPLMSRFAVIDIPDYTEDEKKIIFTKFALPKILKRMSMKEEECVILPEALDEVVRRYSDTTGIRDLEQAAENIAANALYQIEVNHVDQVLFDAKMVRELLG